MLVDWINPSAGSVPVVLANASPAALSYRPIEWSPTGAWIAYPSAEGISMISPGGKTVSKLTHRRFLTFAFSRDGAHVYGIIRNTAGEGAQWQLYSIDVKTGADKMLAPIDLPASVNAIAASACLPTASASSRPSASGHGISGCSRAGVSRPRRRGSTVGDDTLAGVVQLDTQSPF